jgi:uncharacterized phage protein (predicted DNA packaging)
MYVTLEEIKKQINIDPYFKDDDNYLIQLEGVAEVVLSKHIDAHLSHFTQHGQLDPPLKHAILLFVATQYRNRESVASFNHYELPMSYNYLLQLYQCYSPSLNGVDKPKTCE